MGERYYSLESEKVVSSFGSNAKEGLSSVVATQRLKDFGLNEINDDCC